MSAVYVTPRYQNAGVISSLAANVDLPNGVIALRCTVGGVVKVDVGVTGNVISSGVVIPITIDNDITLPITRVYSSGNGTTATGLVWFQ